MTFAAPAWLFLGIPLLVLAAWATRGARTAWLRLAVIALGVFALADPRVRGAASEAPVYVLVDRSRSAAVEAAAEARLVAQAAAERRRPTVVVAFGSGAQALGAGPDALAALDGMPLAERSALADGLDAVAALAAAKATGGDVVVVSDGMWTGRDPLGAAPALDAAGLRLHAATVGPDRANDAAVTRIVGPPRVAAGQPVQLGVEVWAPRPGPAQLQVRGPDGAALLAAPTPLALVAGRNTLTIEVEPAAHAALLDLTVEVAVEGDPLPENGAARFVSEVVGGPRVLVVNQGGTASPFVRALEASLPGTPVDVAAAEGWAPPLAALARTEALVLEDVPLSHLADGGDRTLAAYVDALGGGLVVLGGQSSFANGGYFHSPLEDLLPVSMDLPEQIRRPAVALGIVLDRSGSMAAPTDAGPTKMDLANQGAAAAIGLLEPGDIVAVLAVDEVANEVVPATKIASRDARRALAQQALKVESGGGGIFLDAGLRAGMHVLEGVDAESRHLVLFSDADDTEEPGAYKSLVAAWARAGFTMSVIGLGSEKGSDGELLKDVARIAGGRIYFTADARRLPTLFAEDVMQVARSAWVEDPVAVARGSAFDAPVPATVGGHFLTLLRPGADAWWLTADADALPLLAGWPRGAGRVVAAPFAWGGPDDGGLSGWPGYRDAARATVEWARRDMGSGAVTDLAVDHGRARVSVEVDPAAPLARAPELVVVGPDGRPRAPVALQWEGPGRLSASFALGEPGVHLGVVRVGEDVVALPPAALPQAPEVAFDPDAEARRSALVALAEATGGSAVYAASALDAPRAVAAGWSLAGVLAAAALGLLLVDVAARRGLLPPLPDRTRAPKPAPAPPPAPAPEGRTATPSPDPLAEARERARRRGPRR